MRRNVIEPWEEPPPSIFMLYDPHYSRETNGTMLVYEGITLRVHGEYSTVLGEALLQAHNHMHVEGYK
jgi:hypothetical protein